MNACIEYFQQNELKRFVDAWLKKYQSLGYLGSVITIDSLSDDEKKTLGALLSRDLSDAVLKISYK